MINVHVSHSPSESTVPEGLGAGHGAGELCEALLRDTHATSGRHNEGHASGTAGIRLISAGVSGPVVAQHQMHVCKLAQKYSKDSMLSSVCDTDHSAGGRHTQS